MVDRVHDRWRLEQGRQTSCHACVCTCLNLGSTNQNGSVGGVYYTQYPLHSVYYVDIKSLCIHVLQYVALFPLITFQSCMPYMPDGEQSMVDRVHDRWRLEQGRQTSCHACVCTCLNLGSTNQNGSVGGVYYTQYPLHSVYYVDIKSLCIHVLQYVDGVSHYIHLLSPWKMKRH